jgi:hypothetical protein
VDDDDDEFLIVLGMVLTALAVALLVYVFFLLTLQRALARCRPQNRDMEPGAVWLNLIPIFNIVWQFITVARVSSSLTNEFRARGWHRNGEDYGQTIGITAFGLHIAVIVPILGIVCWLAGLVCFIVYWVRVSGHGVQLASTPATDYYEDDEDEYDYDAPRRRGRRDRDDRDDRAGDRNRDERDQRDNGDPPPQSRPWDKGGR